MKHSIEDRFQKALQTYQRTGSKAAAAATFVFPSSMTWSGNSRGSFLSLAPRTSLPYRNQDPLENSAVVAVLNWITRNFGQAEFRVCRQKRDGTKEPVINHPLQQLLERPNPHYSGQALWSATELSYHLDGNAYWFKERNARGFGIPTALWYVPHWQIKPIRPQDGSKFLSHYEYTVDGKTRIMPPENIIHFRNGINPANTLYGFAPLRAALLNVFSDVEVDLWVAALCYNQAMPGTLISPKGGTMIGMTPEKANAIKEIWKRKFGGDNRGDVGVLDFEAEITQLGYDPSQMDFSAIHRHAETRIAGCLGVPAIVAGLMAGLESSTYNNLDQLKKSAFEERLVPDWEAFEDELDRQLLPDFESNPMERGIYCEFDTSHVRALKEDQDAKEKRILARVEKGVMTVAEAQAELGQTPDPQATYYLIPSSLRPVTAAVALARAAQEITDPKPLTSPNAADTPDAGGDSGQSPQKRLPAFSTKAATVLYPPGTRVRVDGEPHMEGQDTGTVAFVVEGNTYAVVFDGQEEAGPHKWYFEDELEPEGTEEAEPAEGAMSLGGVKKKRPPEPLHKSIEWQGLTLLREPTELEAPLIKAIDAEMSKGQRQLQPLLDGLRARWFEEIASDYADGDLDDPEDLQELQPTIEDADRARLRTILTGIASAGASLIGAELANQGAELTKPESQMDAELMGLLTGAVITHLFNDVRARATASALQAVQLGQPIAERIRTDAAASPAGYVSRLSGQATNVALARGRDAEMTARARQIQFFVYSAVLDANTCKPCGDVDGQTADTRDGLPSTPNPNCKGGASCRCVIIPVYNPNEDSPEPPPPPLKPEPAPTPEPEAEPTGADVRQQLLDLFAQNRSAERRALLAMEDEARDAERAVRYAQTPAEKAAAEQRRGQVYWDNKRAVDAMREPYRALLYQDNAAQVTAAYKHTFPNKPELEKGLRAFERLIGQKTLTRASEIEFDFAKDGRAYFLAGGKTVYLHYASDASKVVHEMAHWLEDTHPGIFRDITDYLERRAAGETPVKLRDLKGNGYRDDEITRPDKFFDPYVGKVYQGKDGNRIASEVLSIGLEYFYADPAYLAEKDPDLFDFIYDLLRKHQ